MFVFSLLPYTRYNKESVEQRKVSHLFGPQFTCRMQLCQCTMLCLISSTLHAVEVSILCEVGFSFLLSLVIKVKVVTIRH